VTVAAPAEGQGRLLPIGRWGTPPKRSMSAASRLYERWVRQSYGGGPPNLEYVVRHPDGKDIWFDGVHGDTLLEAKGHYACFVDQGSEDWHAWYRWSAGSGLRALIGQARRQMEAARGGPVLWLCAESLVADLLGDEFRASPALSGRVSAEFAPMPGWNP
jgi:hypothetical protein